MRRSLMLAGIAVLGVPGLAGCRGWRRLGGAVRVSWWQASPWHSPRGCADSGQGKAIAAAVDAMARQPGAAARIQTAMIIGLALIESLAIYVLVVAMILLFVQPVK